MRPDTAAIQEAAYRNTPTGVGKTCPDQKIFLACWKHPHGRGEDVTAVGRSTGIKETPPRAWGRPPARQGVREGAGNTPTGVGKTQVAAIWQPMPWKHPHGRGEDHQDRFFATPPPETPPRAWGRPDVCWTDPPYNGNTPTGVGKTSRNPMLREIMEKHPHGRGEDRRTRQGAGRNGETPPRAWGRLSIAARARMAVRNTPTGVGKTQ